MDDINEKFDLLNDKNWLPADYGLYFKPGKIKFIDVSNRTSVRDVVKAIEALSNDERFGVMCTSLTDRDMQLLRDKKISYITNNQDVMIFSDKEINQVSKQRLHDFDLKKISPTLLVSPSSFEIIDTIFKLPKSYLNVSPTEFSLKFKLSRPKISKIMRTFMVRGLQDLRVALQRIPLSWWIESFNAPITRRKMTPFKNARTRRYVFRSKTSIDQFCERVRELKDQGIDVEYGGLSYLKILRSVRMDEFDLVARSDHMFDVIEKFDLRPARKHELHNNIFIISVDGNLESEKFKANIENSFEPFSSLEWLNPLRFLWGIQECESRVQEEREYLLGVYFNAITKNNN